MLEFIFFSLLLLAGFKIVIKILKNSNFLDPHLSIAVY